jgi:3'(2'), 5'-bisphosphate nucleotidase
MSFTLPTPTPSERDQLARLFGQIASDAGVRVMEVYESDFETRTKADYSPVSDADERAEEIILARLAQDLPGVPVLAEERASREGVGDRIWDAFILVDPVDGTKEFIQRKGDFTVNIALICSGRPVAGAVFAPARREMYVGGATAELLEGFAPGAAMAPGRKLVTRAYPSEGLTAITSASHLDDRTKAFLAERNIAGQTAIGSSLKFCWVAAGKADVYPRWGPTMEWDTAAGHAVLDGAGGSVIRPDGSPFVYGKGAEGFRNGPFIAWGREPV